MTKTMIALMALALAAMCSCGREEEKAVDTAQCDALYGELLVTYRAYADSLRRLPEGDTTGRAEAVEERFERRMRDIYWRYPVNMDAHLSETQNDTLWHYACIYIEARQRRRHPELTDTVTQNADTIQADLAGL